MLSTLSFSLVVCIYPRCSSLQTFMYFMPETFNGDGEDETSVMRADRSIDMSSSYYFAFLPYAIVMLFVYPFGVPCLYALILNRSRGALLELQRVELTLEADYALAKLRADGAPTAEQEEEILRKADAEYSERLEAYLGLRDELPTTIRKLTAGYELRTFWFESFECMRKIMLVGLPVFFPAGSPGQRVLGLVVCFLTYGACACKGFQLARPTPEGGGAHVRIASKQTASLLLITTTATTSSRRWRRSPSSSRSLPPSSRRPTPTTR